MPDKMTAKSMGNARKHTLCAFCQCQLPEPGHTHIAYVSTEPGEETPICPDCLAKLAPDRVRVRGT